MPDFFVAAVLTALFVFALGFLLARLGRMGPGAAAFQERLTRAPLLDLVLALLTWLPWVVAAAAGGWGGLLGSFAGSVLAMLAWTLWHEWAHREAAAGPRIVHAINRTVGRWQNHAALWVTAIAYPGFWWIRFLQVTAYEALIHLLDFPRYRQAEWINVSRHKFEGLVGHDLLWCLYCDWMTGVYSLGAEMLRNVESFWCPIRFYDGKKCENCRTDFPDIEKGWIRPDGTMREVEETLLKMYGDGKRSWFGHPDRKKPDSGG